MVRMGFMAGCVVVAMVAGFPASAGDLPTLHFRGNESVSSETIRQQLYAQPRLYLATIGVAVDGTAPAAPRTEPPDPHPQDSERSGDGKSRLIAGAVNDLVAAGYQHAGFADVKVHARLDARTPEPNDWVCQITEGRRYSCGTVRLEGCDFLSAEELAIELATGLPKQGSFPSYQTIDGHAELIWVDEKGERQSLPEPVWRKGRPARCDRLGPLRDAVGQVFADHGYPRANYTVERVPERTAEGAASMRLDVTVVDGGPRDRIQNVVFEGLEISTADQWLEHLGLQVGDPITRATLELIAEGLYRSGRIEKFTVGVDRKKHILLIKVDEVRGAPSIGEPLSDSQAAYMNAGRRMMRDAADVDADLVFDFEANGARCFLCLGQEGLVLHATIDGNERSDQLIVGICGDELILDASWAAETVRLQPSKALKQVELGVEFSGDPDPEHTASFKLAGAIHDERAPDQPPLDFQYRSRPSGWVQMAIQEKQPVRLESGHWVVGEKDAEIRVDAASRRLVQMWGYSMDEVLVVGEVGRQWNALKDQVAGKPARGSDDGLVGEIVRFFLDRRNREFGARWCEQIGKPFPAFLHPVMNVCEQMAQAEGVDIADTVLERWGNNKEENDADFQIPLSFETAPDSSKQVLGYLVVFGSRVFECDRWPAETFRAAGTVLLQDDSVVVSRILSRFSDDPDHGPLSHYLLARLLDAADHGAAPQVAALAIDRLDGDGTTVEWDALAGTPWRQAIESIVQAITELSPQDRDALAGLIGNSKLRELVQLIVAQEDENRVRSGLRKLALAAVAKDAQRIRNQSR